MMSPADYELFVKQVIEEISATGTEVLHQQEYTGKISGRRIVVDISFEVSILGGARCLVVVECKHYSSKVSVDQVEEFHSKLDDIGARKGIMITTVGYQEGAIKTAKGREIALALLTDQAQKGEISYVVSGPRPPPSIHGNKLLQGNFRPWGKSLGLDYEGGYRFDSFAALWTMLHLSLAGDLETEDPHETAARAAESS